MKLSAARVLACLLPALIAAAAGSDLPWYGVGATGEPRIHLYFFSVTGCVHCQRASRFLDAFAAENPWLDVHRHELGGSPENRERYARIAEQLGQEARFVPAFAFCETLVVGFPDEEPPGARLKASLLACRQRLLGAAAPPELPAGAAPIRLPILGRVEPGAASLPVLTIVIGALDAFNPCAFFVLLVLLSLLVHAGSRLRIFLVGGVFVLFSGIFYFLFMAAWLNLFLLLGELAAVTRIAGALAVAIALLNVKDYLWLGRGPSLSIPERARPGLFRRMRALVGAGSLPALLAATTVLAMVANSYEMLCTAGFPLVFTRLLTSHELPTLVYYAYLALYNVVYVIPLAAVVVVFGLTLGSRKLGEKEARALKLLSGLMLLGLGAVLLADPVLLHDPVTPAVLLLAALGLTILVVGLGRMRRAA